MGDPDLRMFSCWPACIDPAQIATQRERNRALGFPRPWERDDVAPLPWKPAETLGQTWGNPYTGEPVTIVRIGYGVPPFEDLPVPCYAGSIAEDHVMTGHIGLWWEGRFYIEHWIRLDHLPASRRLRWQELVRIPYLMGEIARLREDKGLRSSRSIPGRRSAEVERELEEAYRLASTLATDARVRFDPIAIHNQGLSGTSRPAQLALL